MRVKAFVDGMPFILDQVWHFWNPATVLLLEDCSAQLNGDKARAYPQQSVGTGTSWHKIDSMQVL